MKTRSILQIGTIAATLLILTTSQVWAHCDTMNGPVVKAGREALDRGDVRYALVWVKPAGEAEIRSAFDKVRQVRTLGEKAKEIADRYFFETLVRVHRAGEGAPYTGLKDSEETPEPGIAAAEHALEQQSVEQVAQELSKTMHHSLGESFHAVQSLKAYPPTDVESGRRYVEAYVKYIHFVDRLHKTVAAPESGHEHAEETHVE